MGNISHISHSTAGLTSPSLETALKYYSWQIATVSSYYCQVEHYFDEVKRFVIVSK